MSGDSIENNGTAKPNWGTLTIVLIVSVVSVGIAFVTYNAHANATPISTLPAPIIPVATPGPSTNYSSVPGQLPRPKAIP